MKFINFISSGQSARQPSSRSEFELLTHQLTERWWIASDPLAVLRAKPKLTSHQLNNWHCFTVTQHKTLFSYFRKFPPSPSPHPLPSSLRLPYSASYWGSHRSSLLLAIRLPCSTSYWGSHRSSLLLSIRLPCSTSYWGSHHSSLLLAIRLPFCLSMEMICRYISMPYTSVR